MNITVESGTVNIRGKEYKTVALRVNEFRASYPDWTIETEIVDLTDKMAVVKAIIKNPEGRVISTGYAEENRSSSPINKTSALENCETSAVGRALAFFGLAGSEIASADEVAAAIGARAVQSVDITEDLAAIDAATDLDGLKEAFSKAYNARRGNADALAELAAAKDRKKRVLTVSGVFSGEEVKA